MYMYSTCTVQYSTVRLCWEYFDVHVQYMYVCAGSIFDIHMQCTCVLTHQYAHVNVQVSACAYVYVYTCDRICENKHLQ